MNKDHVVDLPILQDPGRRQPVHTNCRGGAKRTCRTCRKKIDLCSLNRDTPLNQLPAIDPRDRKTLLFSHFKCTPDSYRQQVATIMQAAQVSEEAVPDGTELRPALA